MNKDFITMSTKEHKRLHFIEKSEAKLITQAQAAENLNMSERNFRRLVVKFRNEGPQGLIHKSRGKASNRKISAEDEKHLVHTYSTEFLGYKPTFFTELYCQEHKKTISSETTRQILIKHDLWTPKPRKPKHRAKRERRHHYGELIQFDGSPHQWFEGEDGYCILMLMIDDATNHVFAKFYPYEGTLPAMDLISRYIAKYGVPSAIYTDKHSTYKNNSKKTSIEEDLFNKRKETQVSRALSELDINLIYAHSSQAKGRVERSFQTMQDRLGKELHRHNIHSIKEANAFLVAFLKQHNKKFSFKPKENANMHQKPLPLSFLKSIFCIKESRCISKDFTIKYKNKLFQLKKSTIHKKALIEQHINGSVKIRVNGSLVQFKNISHMLKKKTMPQLIIIDPISLKEIA